MIQQQPPMQQRLPMGIVPPRQQPQVPPQMAGSPQFGAARQVVMEGLPQIYQQLEELVTLKAVDLVNSADRQEAMDGDPGQSNMQVAENSIKGEAEQGVINALAGMQRQQPMGLPQLPANNMAVRAAAQGGIVGFAGKGPSLVEEEPNRPTLEEQRARYKMLKALEAKYMAEGDQESLNNVRRELENYKGSMAAQPPKPTPENTLQMAGGGIVALDEGGFLDTITGGAADLYEYVKENPFEAAGYASLLVPGGALANVAGRGGLAALRYLAPKALAGLKTTGQALKTGATKAGTAATTRPIKSGYGSAVRGPQGRLMSADAAKKAGLDLNRTFSPARTGAIAGPALLGVDALLDGDDTTEEEIIREVVNTPEGTIEDTFASAMEQAGSTQETIDSAQDRLGEQMGIREDAETQVSREENFINVAQDLQQTPVESSLYDKKLEEIMKRSKSPIRTIATFLQGYGEDKFAGASKAMRAAEAQYDNMEIDLLKLQEANRISQQQFDINMQKIANEKEQLRIMEDRYVIQGENEAARIEATQNYYDVLATGNESRARIALQEAVDTYLADSLRLNADIASIANINIGEVGKLMEDNTEEYNRARQRAEQNYRNAVESGLFRGAGGAGQPIDAAQYFNQ